MFRLVSLVIKFMQQPDVEYLDYIFNPVPTLSALARQSGIIVCCHFLALFFFCHIYTQTIGSKCFYWMEEIIGPLLEQIYFQYGCRFKHGGHFYCDIWCLAGIGGISYALALEAFLFVLGFGHAMCNGKNRRTMSGAMENLEWPCHVQWKKLLF